MVRLGRRLWSTSEAEQRVLRAVLAAGSAGGGDGPAGGDVRLGHLRHLLRDVLTAAPPRAYARRASLVSQWLREFRRQPGHAAPAHSLPAMKALLDAGHVYAAAELMADAAASSGALPPGIVRRLFAAAVASPKSGVSAMEAARLWCAWVSREDALSQDSDADAYDVAGLGLKAAGSYPDAESASEAEAEAESDAYRANNGRRVLEGLAPGSSVDSIIAGKLARAVVAEVAEKAWTDAQHRLAAVDAVRALSRAGVAAGLPKVESNTLTALLPRAPWLFNDRAVGMPLTAEIRAEAATLGINVNFSSIVRQQVAAFFSIGVPRNAERLLIEVAKSKKFYRQPGLALPQVVEPTFDAAYASALPMSVLDQMIIGYSTVGDEERFLFYLGLVLRRGAIFDAYRRSYRLRVYAVKGDMVSAMGHFRADIAAGFRDSVLYNIILRGFGISGDYVSIEVLLAEMMAHSVPISDYSVLAYLQALLKSDKWEKAKNLVLGDAQKTFGVMTSPKHWGILLDYFFSHPGLSKELHQTARAMVSSGAQLPPKYAYLVNSKPASPGAPE